MEPKVTTPVAKGLIIALVLIVLSLVLHLLGESMNRALGSIQYLIIIAGIIWGCINYANQMNNNVTFGNIFAHGFKITAVVTVLMVVYTAIAVKVLFPEIVDIALDETVRELEKREMSDEQIEQTVEMTRKFFFPFAIAGIVFFFVVVGLISSLIGAGVAKKNPQSPFQNG
ncbi:DUF4199 domain-containing protein [Aridibaculum aurantiacum]|uniref:DUF4199 domain-containing protein n=1 Tax=Aridibaculum aurantiacum TaxID=2810307 RepID=UPI001A96495A|nr:DUF4199 domain-containing protein [Aridibaculum aurantiacum]